MKRICLYTLLITITAFLMPSLSFASREEMLLNENWSFRFVHQVQKDSPRRIDLPHTWNAQDALSGKQDYYRGTGIYEKNISVSSGWKGKRLFLRFEGVNTVAQVFVNDSYAGEHRGGYGAFVFEITDMVEYGADNKLTVRVSNAPDAGIMPLVGDFNFYGGIYRNVYLLLTDEACISPLDYASPGVYLIQRNVTKENAGIEVAVMLSNSGKDTPVDVCIRIWDGDRLILEKSQGATLPAAAVNMPVSVDISIPKPHLWNGRKDPFMYTAEVTLISAGRETDRVVQPLGLRFCHVDAEKGFFLNGEPLKLRGVCRHQDRPETGNALRPGHHREDMDIMLEMGVNAIRLSHYPQDAYFLEMLDKAGIVSWAEIPFVGPGGYMDQGFVNSPSFRENGREQLKELIRQQYNHPSICFWGLFNELKTYGDNPAEYVAELNKLAHDEDPTRMTTSASFLEDGNELNKITDLIAWNKYYGWYGGSPEGLARWADGIHKAFPQYRTGISEYGAGASILHQQDAPEAVNASGWWHPEIVQTHYHIETWKIIAEREYIWGSFLWNMFDFGAAHRTEGDRPGINDKGLVTFDRKVKKDAFYFYKANWNREAPFVYIANRRHTERTSAKTGITVFSNMPETELFVNGKSLGRKRPDKYAVFTWDDVTLRKGSNTISVKGYEKKSVCTDSVVWTVR
ncbi:MAG: glycoside hydrolase family 2 protein [Tannerella sp.]|jgi:beta-galactosidase|nr:glycoside hydrolase family 2 protein [Tannerella sp.]